jgi:hypothetical protein
MMRLIFALFPSFFCIENLDQMLAPVQDFVLDHPIPTFLKNNICLSSISSLWFEADGHGAARQCQCHWQESYRCFKMENWFHPNLANILVAFEIQNMILKSKMVY